MQLLSMKRYVFAEKSAKYKVKRSDFLKFRMVIVMRLPATATAKGERKIWQTGRLG